LTIHTTLYLSVIQQHLYLNEYLTFKVHKVKSSIDESKCMGHTVINSITVNQIKKPLVVEELQS